MLTGGNFDSFNGTTKNRFTRLNSDGSLDTGFNSGAGFNGKVNSIVLQTDSKILVGGGFTTYNGTAKNRIIRLNSDGTIDDDFNPGTGFNNTVTIIALQSDGKILVGGSFSLFNGIARNNIARLNSDGSLDTGFNPGAGFNNWVTSVAIQSDGKILVGGGFYYFDGTIRQYIARLNSDGSLDTGFNPGTVLKSLVTSIAIQGDGKIIVGEHTSGYYTGIGNSITRFNSDGSLDTGFNTGTGFNNIVFSIMIQRNGKILVGGVFTFFNGTARNCIARLNSDGSLDTAFNPGIGFNDNIESIAIQGDGKILVGGSNFARLNSHGSFDTGFNNPASGFYLGVKSIVVQDDGNILVGGSFTSFNGIGRNRITRLFGDITQSDYPHFAKGYIYDDQNKDCNKQTTEQGLYFPVYTEPYHSYAFPDSTGLISLGLNDSVNYKIKPIIPTRFRHFVSNPCPPEYNVLLNATYPVDTAGFDFGFEYNPCHQLRVDVISNRRRRCFRNVTTVTYFNEGVIAANGVQVHVKMPKYVIPVSASMPYTLGSDGTLVFNIGTLDADQSNLITIIDSVACIQGVFGLTQCTKAWITPANSCQIFATTGAGWDKSSLMVEGSCVNDTVRFVIYNTGKPGEGDMDAPSEYRIYADNALMQTGTFQIAGGDSLVITVVSGGATIRLEADQRPGHPGNSRPRSTVEACGTDETGAFSIGNVNGATQDDEDVHIEISCMPIIDSYDPNDKQVNPEGVGPQHIVAPGTLLDFMLRFQNTGTDTAYKVVVVDTLSQYLDLSSLELGTSSFPYTFKLSGAGDNPVMTFVFDNINLTDTITNELKSHGFVKFKIAPKPDVALGTLIENFVDIFFDYNEPIRTNTTAITIDVITYTAADLVKISAQPQLNNIYCEGETVTIEPLFEGNNISYRWYKNDLFMSGETTDKLSLTALSPADVGEYHCVATGFLNEKKTLKVILNVMQIDATYINSGTTLTANQAGASYQWINCATPQPIEGETGQSFTPTESGNYAVTVSQGNCSATSSCEAVIDSNTQDKISMYPNPTKGTFTIDFGTEVSRTDITVRDITGRIISEKTVTGQSKAELTIIDGSGIYFVNVRSALESVVLKLIKIN
jgi:uncharacterized delta-60 repeat protein